MSDDWEDTWAKVLFWLMLMAGALWCGHGCTAWIYRREAIERGYAHWTVDERGNTEWVWNANRLSVEEK